MTRPLEGVRICDFTLHAAGPYGTHYLAMLGAECIKIESRMRLDIHRRPHPVYGRLEAAEFDQGNGGKLAIELNLQKPEGVAIAKRLVALSEIVTENFRPGVARRLGLAYEDLKPLRPALVMASVSASGQTGPDWADPGYAPIFGAMGGLGTMSGHADGPPVEMRNIMDNVTGLTMACAVLVALHKARRTGVGEHVDVAAREVAASFIGDAIVADSAGVAVGRRGNDMPPAAPHGVYPCAGEDRWIALAVTTQEEWGALVGVLGSPVALADAAFASRAGRWEQRQRLDACLAGLTRAHDNAALAARLQERGVAAHPSFDARDIVTDPHLRARGAILDLPMPSGGVRAVTGAPWRFAATPVTLERGMPGLGEHNDYVFGELLGMDRARVAALKEAEVIY